MWIGRHLLIELAWLAGTLALALVMTWGAAWSYPLGRDTIWAVGAVLAAAVLAINLPSLHEARTRDRDTHA